MNILNSLRKKAQKKKLAVLENREWKLANDELDKGNIDKYLEHSRNARGCMMESIRLEYGLKYD